MESSLPTTLPDFSTARILVVGDVMLDRYWFGDTSRVSPEAPVPIIKANRADNRPGGAGNVALNIKALGAEVTLHGMIGQDEAAAMLQTQLTAANVTHNLYQIPEIDTVIKLRVISRHQQLLRIDFEEKIPTAVLSTQHQTDFIAHYRAALPQFNLVILSDYNKGTLFDTQTLIKLAREFNIPVLVDPKGHDFNRYTNANIITPNRKEFEAVVGRCVNDAEIISKGRALLTQYKIDTLLITRGEEGMTLIDHQNVSHLEAYARDVFDVTGAGDTVISVLGAAIAAQLDLSSAMALANLAASIAISKLGAATVSPDELRAALSPASTSGILSEASLLQAVKEARAQGKKIVFANGCFDVLHAGHILYLNLAKQLGDYVIVAVNTDESIQKIKGPNRPYNALADRLAVLNALSDVDWVVPFADATPERLLHLIKPDFLVKGGDYDEASVVGADIVKAYGGQIRILGANLPVSSTTLIEKMQTKEVGEVL